MHRRSLVPAIAVWFVFCAGCERPNAPPAHPAAAAGPGAGLELGTLLPTGARLTPTAAPFAILRQLNPGLADFPDYTVDHAVAASLSPDGRTLLVLTSGYNRLNDAAGNRVSAASNEYVFAFDVSSPAASLGRVVQVPNTLTGLAWNPKGGEFYVGGGVDDSLHVYGIDAAGIAERASVSLGHSHGLGLHTAPAAAGVAVNPSGTRAVVANYENDSITAVDLATRSVLWELDLRPGKSDPAKAGVPGGEFPFGVAFGTDDVAYVSSTRDDEVVVVDASPAVPRVVRRIRVGGQPNALLLNRARSRLYVTNGNSDSVSVIDTASGRIIENIATVGPPSVSAGLEGLRGANPNGLALSPDERTLYVTNGGLNAVSVIRLSRAEGAGGRENAAVPPSGVAGLIPTGWYPSTVTTSPDGRMLYVVDAKGTAGPNPHACRNSPSVAASDLSACRAANEYVLQLEKATFLSMPVPGEDVLARLTWQVAFNNHFPSVERHVREEMSMRRIARHVRHVIYVIKENRTYDQILGDAGRGDGDPRLAVFPEPLTPNHHAIARRFVTLDRFMDSGETSGVGWNWSTAARTTDSTEKMLPLYYASRGLSFDWEGNNRNVNVGLGELAARRAANPNTPPDPDLLPGTADVASPATPEGDQAEYLWDAALRHGLSVRNYGCFGDLERYTLPVKDPLFIPLDARPFEAGSVQFFPAKKALLGRSDPFFRGFDQKYPDLYRFDEWSREFDGHVARGDLPNLEFVRLSHDHFGAFAEAIDGVNTPDTQMADNDYALGLLVEKVAKSRYRDDTVIVVVEDDAQDGPDHVDAHRSIALFAGAFVKRGQVVSTQYDTVNLVRTIEDLLGIAPMGLTDGLARPMADLFEDADRPPRWEFEASVPAVLRSTALPLPEAAHPDASAPFRAPRHDALYWDRVMRGQDFSREDALDVGRFNRALWRGLMGDSVPLPPRRGGRAK